jgi:hypothetical protein
MSKRRKQDEPTSWVVTARVVRTVIFTCDGCTREQAEDADEMMAFVTHEQHGETTDWEVLDVEPNV